ncbi:MAG: DUF5683 domain-containing protein [Calditrichia bacterium]
MLNNRLIKAVLCNLLFCSLIYAVQQPQTGPDEIRRLYEQFQYEEVIRFGNRFLNRYQNASPASLAAIHKYMAVTFYNLGMEDSTRTHFNLLLSLNPKAQLDPVKFSPKIIDLFSEIKEEYSMRKLQVDDNTAGMRYLIVQDPRPAAAWRSVILPGWGQFYKEQPQRGLLLGSIFAGGIIATASAWYLENRYHNDYLDSTLPAEINSNYDQYNKWYKARRSLMVFTAVAWLVNVGDAIWSPYPGINASLTFRTGPALQLVCSF